MGDIARLMCLWLLVFANFVCVPICVAQTTDSQQQRAPYLDPDLPVEKRVDDLIGRTTLDEKVSQMLDVAPAIERLKIPAYNWWNEGLHGVARAGYATVFPQAIGLGATWNEDLVHRVADVYSFGMKAPTN
jgi:beta-glucosidase